MEITVINTSIPDCYELLVEGFNDERGTFVKTYQEYAFQKLNLKGQFVEQYYSLSYKGVLRGLHFQRPPTDHTKMIHLIEGEILDVVVDLRIGSPTYGKYQMFHLNDQYKKLIYIPNGLAHGFYVLSDKAIILYNVTSAYSKEYDSGIHWNSLNIPWPTKKPIVSSRDNQLVNFNNFSSPFIYDNFEKVNYNE